jgi:hypothetical protein
METLTYTSPPFEEEDLYELEVQHWINFFGQPALTDTKARIAYVLSLNSSVFHADCGFNEEIRNLLDNKVLTNTTTTQVQHTTALKAQCGDYLTLHMQREADSDHHIIFKNKVLHGHPSQKENIIPLARGIHTSFHELLEQKNLYPHMQIYKLLKLEKGTLDPHFLEALQHIQHDYHTQFLRDPFSIYLPHCFQEIFRRKIA